MTRARCGIRSTRFGRTRCQTTGSWGKWVGWRSHDNIWVYQRPRSLDTSETGAVQQPQRSQCCVPAPSVIEFNQAGDVVNAWGGPDYIPGWPNSEHGILVDDQGYWITGNGVGDRAA